MLDYRLWTFLKLCEVKNYHVVAKSLNMTQPAVSQHIKSLESFYDKKLFIYEDKILKKTDFCEELEKHAKSLYYNDINFNKNFSEKEKGKKIHIGATKSIGEYVITDKICEIAKDDRYKLTYTVDNTKHLLNSIDNLEMDLAIIEGYFDKTKYGYELLRKEELLGICLPSCPLAGKSVEIEQLFNYHLIVREEGSGSRGIFENLLYSENFSIANFDRVTTVSNINIIKKLLDEKSITFAYKSVVTEDNLAFFTIKRHKILHEFNYVFLKNTTAIELIDIFR